MCKNNAEKYITIPYQEPIFLGKEMARSFAAMEHEYDMETWKMYLRIQSSRRIPPLEEASQGCDDDNRRQPNLDVFPQVDLESETIFELELDT
jgi:hypothetical protein